MNNIVAGNLVIEVGKNIKDGNCGRSTEEIESIVTALCHKKLYIGEICNKYHISQRTLERRVEEGKFPQWRKEASGKKYMWWDEIEIHIARNNS